MYTLGVGVVRDVKKGLEYWEKALDQGDNNVYNYFGEYYWFFFNN
jgi:TPR repeat protein